MTIHPVAEAFPFGNSSYDAIQLKLAAAFPLVLLTPGDITSMNFSQSQAVAIPNAIVGKVSGLATLFLYDAADTTSVHNGTSVLVSSDGKRFKSALAPDYFVNVLSHTNTPPGSPVAGDRYIVGAAPTGDWASNADDLTLFDGQDWVFVSPVIGQTVYVRDVSGQMHWGEAGAWVEGAGSFSVEADSITIRELEFPFGMVVESEIATPPGTRVASGVTPAMPLGGTAANINDDSTGTTATTSALGDLSAASVAARIFAYLDLGSVKAIAGIEAKQLSRSTGSMTCRFYTSDDAVTWTAYDVSFTVTTTPTDFAKSTNVSARYVGILVSAANHSTATATLSDLNAYLQATTIADGVKYIVAANGIGVFSGQDTKVAEARDGVFVFYTPYDGGIVLDKSEKAPKRFDNDTGTWISSGGAWVGISRVYTAADAALTTASTTGSVYEYSATTAPTTSLRRATDPVTLSHTAKRAGAKLRLTYECDITAWGNIGATGSLVSASQPCVVAVLRDSETDAIAWRKVSQNYLVTGGDFTDPAIVNAMFEFDAIDNAAHTYTIAIYPFVRDNASSDVPRGVTNAAHRLLTIEEGA